MDRGRVCRAVQAPAVSVSAAEPTLVVAAVGAPLWGWLRRAGLSALPQTEFGASSGGRLGVRGGCGQIVGCRAKAVASRGQNLGRCFCF